MRRLGLLSIGAMLAVAGAPAMAARQAAQAEIGRVIESGTLIVHMLDRPVGQERYEIRSEKDSTTFKGDMEFVDRGSRVQLTASLQMGADLTPIRFQAKGKTYRFVNVDVDVEVAQATARVRQFGQTASVKLPPAFFPVAGYAPLAGRALLARYWERHGRPARIAGVANPLTDIEVFFRGADTVRVQGRDVKLRRYSINGVVWGREALWVDEAGAFAALVTRVHILPMEAIRDDLKDALPQLQVIAARDRVADLVGRTEETRPRAEGTFAIAGARIIDGTGRDAVEDGVIVIRDGDIAAAGPRSSVRIPPGVRVIDAKGATVIPGLWDMHAHVSQIEWASAYLAAGVTTARDMGGEQVFLTAFRDAIAKQGAVGPRLLLAGLVDGPGDAALGMNVAATPDDGRAVVDRYRALGFPQMKLYSRLEPDVVSAITQRAHQAGMTVTGHVPSSLGLTRAIEAGMDHVAHMPARGTPGTPEFDATVALMKARGTVLDSTIVWGELLGRAPATAISSFEPGILQTARPLAMSYQSVANNTDAAGAAAGVRRQQVVLKALHAAGIRLVAGSDGGVPGFSLLREIELYVGAGLTPMQAIQAATVVPARAMGLAATVGTIEVGKRADLLVLDGNPLDDISNIRRGRWVVANGRVYDCAPLWRRAGFTEKQ